MTCHIVPLIYFTFSVLEETEVLSSIICDTAAVESVGEVPVEVVIDGLNVTTDKKFFYKANPVITSVDPLCSFRRWDTDLLHCFISTSKFTYRMEVFANKIITVLLVFLTLTLILSHRGSKLVIEGQNLDSAHNIVVQYTSKNAVTKYYQVSQL